MPGPSRAKRDSFPATVLAAYDLNVPDAAVISRQYHVCIQHAQGYGDDALRDLGERSLTIGRTKLTILRKLE